MSCGKGYIKTIQYLLNCGININIVDNNRNTALLTACIYKHSFKVIQCLVEHGSNVNAVNNIGSTPLLIACIYKHPFEVIQYLVGQGASVDDKIAINYVKELTNYRDQY